MKFAFLIALIIALVAAASATWTMTAPVTGDVMPGSLIEFSFTTDAIVSPSDTLTVASPAFFDATAVAGEGQVDNLCYVGTKQVATSTIPATGALSLTITFTEEVAAAGVVTCTYRVLVDAPAGPFTVTYTDPAVEAMVLANAEAILTVKQAKPTVEITAASSENIASTDVTIKFGALSASTLYGPLTFGYKYESTPDMDVTSQLKTWMTASNFDAAFDEQVRFVIVGGEVWLLTGASSPTEASVSVQYTTWYTGVEGDANKDYSVWATIDVYDVTGTKVVGTMPATSESAYATIYYAAGTVTYTMAISKTNSANPTFTFSIDKYDAATIFGTGSTLSYSVDGGAATTLDTADKSFEYALTAAADKSVSVTGTFTAATYELATVDASIDGQSDSATIEVSAYIKSVAVGTVVDEVLTYTYTIASDATTFTGAVAYDIESSIAYTNTYGDVRAFDAYTPECTSDLGSVSVGSKVTKDDFDSRLIPVMTSGSLETGSKTHIVTCTQKVHAGPKSKSLTITINSTTGGVATVSKDMSWDTVETTKYNQKVVIKGSAITSQADMTALLAKVTALFVAEWDGESDMVAADYVYHYVKDTVQDYASSAVGLAMEFTNPMVNHHSKAGSMLTLAFTRPLALNDAYMKTFISTDLWVMISGDANDDTVDPAVAAPTTDGLTEVATYVDGAIATGFILNSSIGNGLGFKCATSAQCASQMCLENMCVELGQLSREQQASMVQGYDGSSASAVFTTLALAIAVVALLF